MRTGTPTGRPRRLTRVGAVAVLAWVVAVVVGSAIAWRALAVVDSGERTGVLSQSQVDAALAAAGPAATHGTPLTPTPSETTPTPTPQPTQTTTSPPPAAPTVASTPAPEPTRTTAPAPAPPAPTTAEVARTWTVAGGIVAVSCRGGVITLLYATPSDGWTVDVGSPGPERVEVELHRGRAETKLTGTCVAGVPDSHVDSEDASGGGSDDRGSAKVGSSATER